MTLVSIDPGTSTCGVAIWKLDDNLKIKQLSSFTIIINKDEYLENRLNILYRQVYNVIKFNNPYHLIHETGFIDRFRPQAYGPIYAAIFLIRQAYRDVNQTLVDKGIFGYSPKYVKSVVSTGIASKDDMTLAVTNIKEINKFITGLESEHAIDAIAIGYSHIRNIRETPEMLLL